MSLDKIIVALDGMDRNEIFEFVGKSHKDFSFYKIGMEAFYKEGHLLVKELYDKFGIRIFLDLKLYDIPNTVSGAIKSLSGLPIEFLTLHLQGGKSMCKRALETKNEYLSECKLLGVSYLTSFEGEDFKAIWGIDKNEQEQAFDRLFSIADQTNIDGVVCSPLEASDVKNKYPSLITVCPGVRLVSEISSGVNIGDQKRVLSPKEAFVKSADYLVMGRSLTTKERPYEQSTELLRKELL
ncbi:orotidine 5'-phosphate decarboxylase [Bacteriovorax sp. BSW11_IV]|uniref:orotidine-5'-phosphate decarboxylase n=1 Tax=Bacteriovorax sp. BSW11_IV TaxID=1353529 RepID=UPI00038A3B58|nr:orotidine-5'-phosphate decarboxylase [Bacteriovorax sp. BSW11_IV]EQC48449.1 orotidine 5'-phosphate decarboxylase [Bacteriovorax sp. BSW11_IV]